MSSEILLPRKKFSSYNSKLYKSLGPLIKEYRQWRNISQEKFAELIQISVRELQNWEADRRRVRIENLHDLSEISGIPMPVLVALNADQPIWYSLRQRLFMHSLIEKAQYSSKELFSPNEKSQDHTLLKTLPITTEKQINMILSCHSDLYGTKRSLQKDVIMKASTIFPNMVIIIFDCWGHYVAHRVCLPIKMGVYEELKKQNTLEEYLTCEMISDIISIGEGVFFNYSTFASNIIGSSWLTLNGIRTLSKINNKDRYMFASHTATKESEIIQKNLNMTFVRDYAHLKDEVCPVIYETRLDYQLRPDGPFGWMIKSAADKVTAENVIRVAHMKRSQAISDQDTDKFSDQGESTVSTKKSENVLPLIVDTLPSIVDERNRGRINGKIEHIKPKTETCTNPKCTLYGNTEKCNIVSNGTYRTKEGTPGRRFLCKECGKSFCSRTGTIFYDIRSPEEKVLNALKLLAKGMPLHHVVKSMGVKFHTVSRWLKVAALQREKINAMLSNEPDISLSELDNLWNFIKKKSLRQSGLLCRAKKTPNPI